MILGLLLVRKMLDMVFSQHDLAWIDDLLKHGVTAELGLYCLDQTGVHISIVGYRAAGKVPRGYSNHCPSPDSDLDRSITLHLKISCPSSPAVPIGRGMGCPVPQVKIEMESDYDSDIDPRRPRDMSSETTL
ncbi:hypothetical protein KUCAC02_029023 [Chaenocephalus aceratus]|uniref:Uncharacterized protein n=1 Tax=Chaenocephalus aceratus TaxID=36190 RepID=A0ACB9X560_CHAAC|nr:hypothetical protein KUCAC02_029023 [Chaenocephalus aceratus]